MAQPLDQRQLRMARNEAAFRETNDQIGVLNAVGAQLPEFPIVCECGSGQCAEVLRVDGDLYEDVRASPHRFLLKSGHESLDVEYVVEDHGEIVVVQKRAGAPQRIAEETDPRDDSQLGDAVVLRIAENEARFRDANEHIEKAVLRLEADAATLPFVCECGRPDCLETMRLTIDEYEQARDNPRCFICSPGHEIVGANLGRVLRETTKFVIVEKIGDAGAVAAQRDPRSDD
jgi:hypothetical protein